MITLFLAHPSIAQYKSSVFTGAPLPYLGYVPETDYDQKDWPLLLFLHGVGERGDGSADDLEKVKRWGPPQLIENNEMPPGFVVIAPQLPKQYKSWEPDLVDEILRHTLEHYNVNENRIYLTGLSLGGNGTWRYAYSDYNQPNKLAAIIPVAAWGDPEKACTIVDNNIAVWAFHGVQDKIVTYDKGLAMFDGLKQCGRDLPLASYRFTSYDNVGHNSWKDAYAVHSPELSVFEWLTLHSLTNEENDSETANLEVIAELPASLPEASGITIGNNGTFWLHNDSGNTPHLIQLDSSGNVKDLLKVVNASNYDWEDLTSDNSGNIYIADIGNNGNIRKELFIYKIDPQTQQDQRVKASAIRFTYPEQVSFPPVPEEMKYDAEGLIHYKNHLFIFTKNRTVPFNGYTYVYRLPDQPGSYSAELVDSIYVGDTNMIDNWITGAAISPDHETIVLLGHGQLHFLTCFENGFGQSKIITKKLDSFTQKEAITFSDDHTLWIADENFMNIMKGKLYRLQLSQVPNSACD